MHKISDRDPSSISRLIYGSFDRFLQPFLGSNTIRVIAVSVRKIVQTVDKVFYSGSSNVFQSVGDKFVVA